MPSLFVIQGRDQGKRFELDRRVLGVGRDVTNPIQLHDTEVSRRHAELRAHNDVVEVVDLESSNGTFVNGEPIQQVVLSSGDRLQVGRTLMIFTSALLRSGLATDQVDIVLQGAGGSKIISSIAHEEGHFGLEAPDLESSPWLARARSNLQIMYRTALAVSHTMDIDQLLVKIMELIFEWVRADRGCVLLVDRETGELQVKVRRDRQAPQHDSRMSISRTILDYVRDQQQGVLTSDAREDQRFDAAGSIITTGVREAICVPMQGRYGTVGLIYIYTFTPPGRVIKQERTAQFNEEHLKLMVAIGHQAALAIEDTSYYSALVQAERLAAIGQTIAGLSHHVKNILQGIRGGSYLIEEGLKANDQEVTRRGWRIVEKNQERISSLVLDMLTYSKDRQPELVDTDLNEVVADVLELMQVRAVEANVELVDRRGSNIPLMVFDGEGLHRAILNVVTNAIDACESASEGCVSVATSYDEDQQCLTVVVEDNGPGIAAEERQRIFSLFESEKGHQGTGLGLPVSLKILREHHGDILVESDPGKGSRFILQWPAIASTNLQQTQCQTDVAAVEGDA